MAAGIASGIGALRSGAGGSSAAWWSTRVLPSAAARAPTSKHRRRQQQTHTHRPTRFFHHSKLFAEIGRSPSIKRAQWRTKRPRGIRIKGHKRFQPPQQKQPPLAFQSLRARVLTIHTSECFSTHCACIKQQDADRQAAAYQTLRRNVVHDSRLRRLGLPAQQLPSIHWR